MTAPEQYASVRYLLDDVAAATDFYTTPLGFSVNTHPAPAFADVVRGSLRLLLSGPTSSGPRATPTEVAGPGRNRIHLLVEDLDTRSHQATPMSPSAARWSHGPAVARSCSPSLRET